MLLQSSDKSLKLRVLACIDARASGNEGEGHQNVGSSQLGAAEELAIVRRRSKLRLQEREVRGVVVEQVEAVDFVGDAAGDRLDEEGNGGAADVFQEWSAFDSTEVVTGTRHVLSMNMAIMSKDIRLPSA